MSGVADGVAVGGSGTVRFEADGVVADFEREADLADAAVVVR